ncbi:hypothetical protein Syun_010019 [Stephania yunnanensis]|uniref:Uncharacterized protein n=1 Tax=Stephania yunnanensis TaxID=152371 RepID=A0AAP0KIC5_9MAGN
MVDILNVVGDLVEYLRGFHTCVGTGGEKQTAEWYKEKGIEVPLSYLSLKWRS